MLREILDAVLSENQRKAGLYLEEENDHLLLLKQGVMTRAVFSQTGTTVLEIQKEAGKWVQKGGERE